MLKDVIQEQIANESELVYKIKGVHEPVFNYVSELYKNILLKIFEFEVTKSFAYIFSTKKRKSYLKDGSLF